MYSRVLGMNDGCYTSLASTEAQRRISAATVSATPDAPFKSLEWMLAYSLYQPQQILTGLKEWSIYRFCMLMLRIAGSASLAWTQSAAHPSHNMGRRHDLTLMPVKHADNAIPVLRDKPPSLFTACSPWLHISASNLVIPSSSTFQSACPLATSLGTMHNSARREAAQPYGSAALEIC